MLGIGRRAVRRGRTLVRVLLTLLLALGPGSGLGQSLEQVAPPAAGPALARGAALVGAATGLGVAAALLRPVAAAAATAPPTSQSPWGWGHDNAGQMGNGVDNTDYPSPVAPTGLPPVVGMAAGQEWTLAVTTGGNVYAYGQGTDGQLGINSTADYSVPVQVLDSSGQPGHYLTGIVAVAAGDGHSLALDGAGNVWAWGLNDYGQLGNGTTTTSHYPVAVSFPSGTTIAAIAAGGNHSLAIDSTGHVWGWGDNASSDLGIGCPLLCDAADQPVEVPGPGDSGYLANITAIGAGGAYSLALDQSGNLWAWGNDQQGQLGFPVPGSNNCNNTCAEYPTAVSALTGVTAIAAGNEHSLAVVGSGSAGVAYAWGDNSWGQLGTGSLTSTSSSTPLQVSFPGGGVGVVGVAAGERHSLARASDGTVWAWGDGQDGQLGQGGATLPGTCNGVAGDCDPTPLHVVGPGGAGLLGGVVGISAGWAHSVALGGPPIQAAGATANDPPFLFSLASLDPVQTFTGSYAYQHTDLAIPGRGPAPIFTRAYNTNDPRVGPLGPGWTDSYAIRLTDPGDGSGNLDLVGPQGRSDLYTHHADGSYSPPPAVATTLVRDPTTGVFTATLPDQTTWAFSSDGRLTALADRYGNVSALGYNAALQLTTVSDPAGRGTLTLNYDPTSGRLTSVEDWTSRTVKYSYDSSGRLATVTDRDGQVTTYGYNGTTSELASITDANGHVAVAMTFDGQGRVLTQTDALGYQTSFGYTTNPDGSVTTVITYPVTSFDGFSPTVTDSYDSQGRITQRTARPSANPAEATSTGYTYDANSRLATATDGKGNVTSFCYDLGYDGQAIPGSVGNLTRTIDPPPTSGAAPLVTLSAYDAKNNLIETIPPAGVTAPVGTSCQTDLTGDLGAHHATDFGYDRSLTYLQAVTRTFTDPELGLQTAVTSYQYQDPANPGRVTATVPPRGQANPSAFTTHFAYGQPGSPAAGMVLTTTDALGDQTTDAYDAVGRRTGMIDPNGYVSGANPADHRWSYGYDAEDRLTSASAPAPTSGGQPLTTQYQYDPVGNRTVAIDANGQVTKYLYDARDSLAEVDQSPLAWTTVNQPPATVISTTYAYDGLGNLTQVTRAAGDATNVRATAYTYDGLDRLRTETQYPAWPAITATLVTTTTYDLNGNRATLQDPLGKTTSFAYDALNRLTGISYSDGVTPNVAYTYDADGNRLSMQDGTGTTSYAYDEADHLLAVTSPGNRTVGYRYDLDGNRRTVSYPGSTGSVTYAFDDADRLQSLTDWASHTVTYTYTADGSPATLTNPNGTTGSLAYDHALRLTGVTNALGSATIDSHSYTLDSVGNRLTDAETLASAGSQTPSAWGSNSVGQLGATSGGNCGGTPCSEAPLPVSGPGGSENLTGVVALAAGRGHTVALKSDGTVWAWGANDSGQLGNNTTTSSASPVQVVGVGGTGDLTGIIAVSAGISHTLALASTGTVYAWGNGADGQLGTGGTANSSVPVAVAGISAGAISAGADHSLALKADGSVVWAWGLGSSGQLGNGQTSNQSSPVQVSLPPATTVTSIAGGGAHSLAATSGGTVLAWGSNTHGQLGNNNLGHGSAVPVATQVLTETVGVAGGYVHSLAREADGTVWAWGDGADGQLGNGGTSDSAVPVRASGLVGAVAISAGQDHSLALDGNGQVWGWGANNDGQLGDGTTTTRTTAVPANTAPGMTAIAAGSWHSLALATTRSFTNTYTYDGLDRLVSGGVPGFPQSYSYDPVGNRLSLTRGPNVTPYTYDKADRIQSAGSTPYTVGADGNVVARDQDSFAYDQANRLVSATVGGTTTTYAYDGDGQRAAKTVGSAAPITYTYDINQSLPMLLSDGTRNYVYGLGLAFSVDTGGNLAVYHTDGLGSVRALTDQNGNVIQTYQADEFGVPALVQGTNAQPFGYAGQQTDAESGFQYLRARMYDPSTGRFLQRDPVPGVGNQPQTLNSYAYGVNDPTTVTDPSGAVICRACTMVWALVTVVSAVWSGVSAEQTFQNPRSSLKDKLLSTALFLGSLTPEGGSESLGTLEADFETPQGTVGAMANVFVEDGGKTLHLADLAVYPRDAEKLDVGAPAMLAIVRQVAAEAKAMGFETLRISGLRYSGANPGHAADLVIRLVR